MNLDGLPALTDEQRNNQTLVVAAGNVIKDRHLARDSGTIRLELLDKAKWLCVNPNTLLAIAFELTEPGLKALFKPFMPEEIETHQSPPHDLGGEELEADIKASLVNARNTRSCLHTIFSPCGEDASDEATAASAGGHQKGFRADSFLFFVD